MAPHAATESIARENQFTCTSNFAAFLLHPLHSLSDASVPGVFAFGVSDPLDVVALVARLNASNPARAFLFFLIAAMNCSGMTSSFFGFTAAAEPSCLLH
jgi:hypothetical protein